MADTQNGRVAVYLDFDNIVLSWYDRVHGRNSFGRDRHRIAENPNDPEIAARLEAAAVDVGAIIDYASSFGTLVLTRAYADWSSPINAVYRSQLVARAVDLVQLFPAAAYAKNGADIRLAVDVVEDMFRLDDLTHVIIVAGDSDYVPLAQRCKRLGRYVVGIGVAGSTAKSLTAACDEFASYDALPGMEHPGLDLMPARSGRGGRGRSGSAKSKAESTADGETTPGQGTGSAGAEAGAGSGAGDQAQEQQSSEPTSTRRSSSSARRSRRASSNAKNAAAAAAETEAAEGAQTVPAEPATAKATTAETKTSGGSRSGKSTAAPAAESQKPDDAAEPQVDFDAQLNAALDAGVDAGEYDDYDDFDLDDDSLVSNEDAELEITGLLIRALWLGQEKDDADWLHSSAVKQQMRRMDPSFNEKALGFRSFSDFLKSRSEVAELSETGHERLVRLRDQSH